MAWDDSILDQPQVVGLLRRAINSGRIAHAYLFHGPDGVGKRAVAVEMACTLQCEHKTDSSCGNCKGCERTRMLQHPDVHVLMPQHKDVSPEEEGQYIQELAKNPYATVKFNLRGKSLGKQSIYSIDRIRKDLKAVLSLRPREGGYRVVIMIQADAMNAAAANAFLKLLEEPGSETVLMLTTNRTDQLLPTILSRCQHVRFSPLAEETIAHALTAREGLADDAAKLYARMAGGSYTAAFGVAVDESFKKDRDTARKFLEYAHQQNVTKQVSLIAKMNSGGREYVKGVLEHALVWIRDLLLWHTLKDDARITNIDQVDFIHDFSRKIRNADLENMANLVDEGRMLSGTESFLKVLLITLIQALGKSMRGKRMGSLYMPLTQRRYTYQ